VTDFLQRPTPFINTLTLISASGLLKDMMPGSSTLVLLHSLAMVGG
jgi:hypothetical protein